MRSGAIYLSSCWCRVRDGCSGADLVIPLIIKKPRIESPDPPEPTVFACARPVHDNLFELISKSVEIPASMEQKTSKYELDLGKINVKEEDAFISYSQQSSDTEMAKIPKISESIL